MKYNYLVSIKNISVICLFFLVFYSNTVHSHETLNIGWRVEFLQVFDFEIDYLEIDVTVGKRFSQVNGIAGYTDGSIQLMNGTGFDMGEYYYIEVTMGLDLIQITLEHDENGMGRITYYSINDENELFLVGEGTLFLLGVE